MPLTKITEAEEAEIWSALDDLMLERDTGKTTKDLFAHYKVKGEPTKLSVATQIEKLCRLLFSPLASHAINLKKAQSVALTQIETDYIDAFMREFLGDFKSNRLAAVPLYLPRS